MSIERANSEQKDIYIFFTFLCWSILIMEQFLRVPNHGFCVLAEEKGVMLENEKQDSMRGV